MRDSTVRQRQPICDSGERRREKLLLFQTGGKARKGNGRNYKLGYGECTEDTVVGCIAKDYAGKKEGMSVFDPVFVLSAILDWEGIAHNERGYLELPAEYQAKATGR